MSYRQLAWIGVLWLTVLIGPARAQTFYILGDDDFFLNRDKKKPLEFLNSVAYSPDGKTLVSAGKGGFFFWNAETGKRLEGLPILAEHGAGVRFSPDGKSLYTADAAGIVLRWDVDQRKIAFRFPQVHSTIERMDLSHDGSTLTTSDGVATVFCDARTGKLLHLWNGSNAFRNRYRYRFSYSDSLEYYGGMTGQFHQVLSTDGRWCAYQRDDRFFEVRSTKSDLVKHRWPDRAIASIDISADGKTYALAGRSGDIEIVESETFKRIHAFKGPGADCLVRFSPDAKILIGQQTEIGVLTAYDLTTGRTLWQHQQAPAWRSTALAFSPDGKHLATGDSDRRIRVYDQRTGKIVRVIDFPAEAPPNPGVRSTSPLGLPSHARLRLGEPHLWYSTGLSTGYFLNEGKQLLLMPYDGHPMLYDAQNGKLVRTCKEMGNAITHSVMAPDRRHLLLTGQGQLLWWNLDTNRAVHEYQFPGHITAVAIARDGKRFAVACRAEADCPQPIHVWDLETGRMQSMQGHDAPIGVLGFSPDGKRLFSCSVQQHVNLGYKSEERPGLIIEWDLAGGTMVRSKVHYAEVASLSADGNTWALQHPSRKVELFDWKRQATIAWTNEVERFVFSLDGQALAVGGMGKIVSLWDARVGKVIRTFKGHVEMGTVPLCFSADGKTLATMEASSGSGGSVRLWDVATGTEICRNPYHRGPVECVAYTPDGRHIVSAGHDRRLLWWDAKTGKLVGESAGVHERPIRHLTLSRDGRFLASASDDCILVWEVQTKKIVLNHGFDTGKNQTGSALRAIALDRAGKELRFVDISGGLATWDIATGKRKTSFNVVNDKNEYVRLAAFSADGTQLAVTESQHNEIVVWNVAQQKPTRRLAISPPQDLETHRALLTCSALVFSADGRYLAGMLTEQVSWRARGFDEVDQGSTIGVWEIASGTKAVSISGIDNSSATLAFSPDGRSLLHGLNPRAAGWPHGDFGMEFSLILNGRQAQGAVLRDLTAGKDLTHHQGTGPARVCATTGWELREIQGVFAAFAPDGKSIATVDGNRTILVWDAQAFQPPGPAPTKLTTADLERAWKALADLDAARAHAALWHMTRDPEAALAFLQTKLKAPNVPTASRLQHLLRELDSSHFTNRVEAMRELEQYGELAEPTLRAALASVMPTERKRRLESLLARSADDQRPERLQERRGVEILEKLNHPEARRVLEDLARGPGPARITREARAALDR